MRKSSTLQALIFLAYVVATLALGVLVLVAVALRKLYEIHGWPPEEPAHSNCWAVAVPLWLRHPARTYLAVRKSGHTLVPHVMYVNTIDQSDAVEYVPVAPRKGLLGVLDSFWFRGKLRKGKGEE